MYLPISLVSVGIGVGLGLFYVWEAITNQGGDLTIRFVMVILILLSARQNLRQHYFVNIIESLIRENIDSG